MSNELQLMVTAELNDAGEPMIKIIAAQKDLAAGFRFPAADFRKVGKSLHDMIMKMGAEIEAQNALQSRSPERKIQVAQQVDRQALAGFLKQQNNGKPQN